LPSVKTDWQPSTETRAGFEVGQTEAAARGKRARREGVAPPTLL
jgi:hypothetical protein